MSLLHEYANEAVTITPAAATPLLNGQPDYTSTTSVLTTARVLDKTKNEYRPDATVTIYDRIFLLKPSETINVGDRITYNSTNHEVVEIKRGQHLDGIVNHKKVMVLIDGVR